MFPNLEAEQARRGLKNEYVAHKLSISRQSYEHKKKTGNFKLIEINQLMFLFDSGFDYLFEQNEERQGA